MTFLNKTPGLTAWLRVLHLAARRPGAAAAQAPHPPAHVPTFGLLVARGPER